MHMTFRDVWFIGVTGSGSKGGASSMGLSGSSSGFTTSGSWYISIEGYSCLWMFHGIGARGLTGSWMGDGMGGHMVRSLDRSLGGSSGRTGRGLAAGVVARGVGSVGRRKNRVGL